MAAAALSMQSCLFEQKDIFEESSSVRLQNLLDNAKATLISSEDGWLMEMYPEANQAYGGYAFILKFDADQKVTAYTELSATPEKSVSSLYKISNEDGAVLVFDGYNSYLHIFSTPSSSAYQSYQGEFEFVIMRVEKDLITLRGTKTGNIMYLRRFSGDPVTYLKDVAAEEEIILMSGFIGSLGGKEVIGDIDIDNRQVTLSSDGGKEKCAYTVTPEGIRLYRAVGDIAALKIDADATISVIDGPSNGVQLTATYPKGYRKYDEYAGKYLFSFYTSATKTGEYPCELVPSGDGLTYLMKGVSGCDADGVYNPDNDVYDVILTYSKAKGNLSMLLQNLSKGGEPVKYNNRYVGLTPLQSTKDGGTSGYLVFNDKAGVMTEWNEDEANPVYTWKNNGAEAGRNIDCFWVCTYSGPTQTSATRSSGSSLPVNYKFFGKTHLVWKPLTLKKVN